MEKARFRGHGEGLTLYKMRSTGSVNTGQNEVPVIMLAGKFMEQVFSKSGIWTSKSVLPENIPEI
jgi:hypothetical protein